MKNDPNPVVPLCVGLINNYYSDKSARSSNDDDDDDGFAAALSSPESFGRKKVFETETACEKERYGVGTVDS